MKNGMEDEMCCCGGVITEFPDGVFTCSECTYYFEATTAEEIMDEMNGDQ